MVQYPALRSGHGPFVWLGVGGACGLWLIILSSGYRLAPLVPVALVGMVTGSLLLWQVAIGKRWAVIGLYVVAIFWISSTFRGRPQGEVGLDWQNGSKIMLSGGFLAVGLFNIRRIMAVCNDPVMFCIILCLMLALLSVVYSEAPAVTVATVCVAASYAVFACLLVQVLPIRDIMLTTTWALGAFCLINLLSALVVPDMAITLGDATVSYPSRLQGISGQPNQLGTLAKGFMIFVIGSAYYGYLRPALWVSMAVMGMGTIALTQSRTSFFALVVACGLQLPRRILVPIVVCIAVIVIGIFVSGQTTDVLELIGRGGSVEEAETLSGRTELWQFTWDLIMARPWLGYGFNSFESFAQTVWTGDSWAPIIGPHNNYLGMLYSGGILGSLPWIAAFAILLCRRFTEPVQLRDLVVVTFLMTSFSEAEVPGNSIVPTLSLFLIIAIDAKRRYLNDAST